MNVSEIMKLLDEESLDSIGKMYQVDKKNHKIKGKLIVMSLIKNALLGRSMSLRMLEKSINEQADLKSLLKTKNERTAKVDHSGLGKRLNGIEANYFKTIYEELVEKANQYTPQNHLHRFDSTLIHLSGKLLKEGLNLGGKPGEHSIKMAVGLKGTLPSRVRFCTEQSEGSDDLALGRAINESKKEKEDIILFDRGILRSATYQDFDQQAIKFVTRVNTNRRYQLVKENKLKRTQKAPLKIEADLTIQFYNKKNHLIDCPLRLIKTRNEQGEVFHFLTNLHEMDAREVTEIYKRRWDIEVFFKFIKQHLQFKHFISYTLNGMQVYIYCLLIAALLFLIFKATHQLKGFKLPLFEFTLALEKEMIKYWVVLAGGNLDLIKDRL